MAVTPAILLVFLALIFAVASLVPPWPGHHLLAVAVILLAVAGLAGVVVHP